MRLMRMPFVIVVALGCMSGLVPAVLAKGGDVHLGFVLLSEPRLPKGEDVERSVRTFAVEGQKVQFHADKGGSEVLEFQLTPKGKAFVMLMPLAVPNGEAEAAVRYSISWMGTNWKIPAHKAHLVVTCDTEGLPLESMSIFTTLLAAVVEASPTVGIYLGGASATHDPKFFLSTARNPDVTSRMMLWTGVSLAREANGRLSFLSLGMKQLNLPDLLLTAPMSAGNGALTTFFDLLSYVASRGKPLPEGDTVGRSADEKLPVHYDPSPLNPKTKVWRVELK